MDMTAALPSAAMQLAQLAAERAARERAERHAMRASATDLHWYVAHNSAGHDGKAKEMLQRADYELYYPVTAERRLKPRKHLSQKQRRSMIPVYERIEKPLFPRYFFVHFDLRDGTWRDVFNLAGLRGILADPEGSGRDPMPAVVTDGVIDKYRGMEINGAIPLEAIDEDIKAQVEHIYEVGEQVRINEGCFRGFNGTVQNAPEGKLEDLDESARVKLLVSLFGRSSVVEMSIFDIQKL